MRRGSRSGLENGRLRLVAVMLCVSICGVSVIAESELDAQPLSAESSRDVLLQKKAQNLPSSEDAVATMQKNAERVNDSTVDMNRVKKVRAKERAQKAQDAVMYMENYRAKKTNFEKEKAKLREQIDKDKMEILRVTPGLRTNYERNRKHDKNIKENMKRALHAMVKVDHLVRGKVKPDATVKAAQKTVNKAQGSSIFTVLGLDSNQLSKDYLLDLDAAVAAYDAKPTAMGKEKLQKSLKTTKERMQKDKIEERKWKSEKAEKKKRDKQNAAYYDQKWKEKKGELDAKKKKRDMFVTKLKKKMKREKWVKTKNKNEATQKKAKYDKERSGKVAAENNNKELEAKRAKARKIIHENYKRKIDAGYKKLQDKAMSAKSEWVKKATASKRARSKETAAKFAKSRKQQSESFAKAQETSAVSREAIMKSRKSSIPSAMNIQAEKAAQAYLDGKKAATLRAKFGVDRAKTKVQVQISEAAKARIEEKTALRKRMDMQRSAATFKAKATAAKRVALLKLKGNTKKNRRL